MAVIVGVDGSPGSIDALRFGIEEARLRGTDVKIVSAWHIPAGVYDSGWAAAPVDLDEYRKLAQASLDENVASTGVDTSGVTITPVLREGSPADVLCEEATAHDLLVVGSRGLGSVRGLLLGSVSREVVQHAPCPVVVIPHKHEEDAPGTEAEPAEK